MNLETKHCHACGSKQDSADFGKRVFFACDSFAYVGENKLAYQTDLCRAWQTLNRIRTIATTDHESKQAFIDRVNAILNEKSAGTDASEKTP